MFILAIVTILNDMIFLSFQPCKILDSLAFSVAYKVMIKAIDLHSTNTIPL